MSEMPLETFISFVAIFALGAAILSLFSLRLTLTRRLKKKLKATDDYWDSGTLDFGLLNTFIFAWACTLPFVPRAKNFQAMYGDLDVKSFATSYERGTAYALAFGMLVFFISVPLFYLFKP